MRERQAGRLERIGVIAHYNLLEALRPSGPGELFRARDTIRGLTVVIRRLPAGSVNREDRRRLEQAALALSALSHPNIIRLFEIGDDEGRLFLVFEHLKGQSLRQEMDGRPVGVRRAVRLAIQMADAVEDAHGAGYLHGGLSPDSVVVTARDRTKIPAHELACRMGFDGSVSPARLVDYSSPEEVAGRNPDERSDVFSVGAILYEMLTARRPSVLGAALPSATNTHVDAALDEVVMRAVAPNPDKRYARAAELAAALRRIEEALVARGSGDDEELPLAPVPRRGRAIAVALLVVAILGLAAWWFMTG